ncbi:MAG: hypothetical protein HY822_08325 [Acidobacteria bacterium]|nr:hypothetical protein [Acidobacteriota bacterium]
MRWVLGLVSIALGLAGAEAPLSERLEAWKQEIEQAGGQVVVARIATDPESGQIRIPPGTPRRIALARYLAEPRFAEQFARTHATTINHPSPEGRVHFVLLNMARAGEWKDGEEALLAHEFGHAWLDARGFRSPPPGADALPCLAIQSGDIVQHVLIRRELDSRGIPFRSPWIRSLEQALDKLRNSGPGESAGTCDALARITLWTDVRLGLTPEQWGRAAEFDQAFRKAFPVLAPVAEELAAVLSAVDLTALERYHRALAYVRQRLAVVLTF